MRAPTIIHLPATLSPTSFPTPSITSKPTSIFLSRSDSLSPTTAAPQPRRKNYLIYFITGNPGLIGYYDLFLSYLHLSLADRLPPSTQVNFDVFGRSLSGFESETRGGFLRRRCAPGGGYPAEAAGGRGAGLRPGARPPFGLEEQIKGAEWALWDHVQGMREQAQEQEDFDPRFEHDDEPNIILVGHSVGAYIAMEIMRRWRENLTVNGSKEGEEDEEPKGKIAGAICLFPTVTHIAKSDSGKKFSALLSMPYIALILHMLVTILTFWIPSFVLFHLVQFFACMPEDAARTTTSFIKSRHGIRQALHMAKEELRTITDDRWDAELWGAATPSPLQQPRPKLYFLWGRKDHWVADSTREELIQARGRANSNSINPSYTTTTSGSTTPTMTMPRMTRSSSARAASEPPAEDAWKPVMEIDDTGVPHGFCIEPRHSAAVAEKVVEYVCEMVRADS
ncbi:hypothetical protein IWZ03DRAFT_20863 [Phyllosticta citriasiana]|uniref:Lipid droplet-associated hydrolase n=1 Tax=Phyllosticta citriasiana TaxID=595635 RepID=A0ABR1KZK5_9PEZI